MEKHYCNGYGIEMNEGEAKTFTCCEVCWDKHYGNRDKTLWNWKHFIDLNDNMSLEHIYQMLKDLDNRLQNIETYLTQKQ